jgi:hypothetical protein
MKANTYRAPTRSLLSMEGAIEGNIITSKNPYLAKVDDVQIKRASSSPVAHTESRYIRLKGILIEAEWSCEEDPKEDQD